MIRTKWKFFGQFVEEPVSTWIQICFIVPCFFIPFAFFLFNVIFFFTHNSSSDKLYLAPAPFTFAAFGVNPFRDVFRIYSFICVSVVVLFFLLSIVTLLKINYRIALFQWRGLFIQVYFLIVYGFFIWFLLIGDHGDDSLFNYIECVGSHPRIDPPPCHRNLSEGRILLFLSFLVIFLFPVVVSFVVFWTNPLVFEWWKELIFRHKAIRSAAELDSVHSQKQSSAKIES